MHKETFSHLFHSCVLTKKLWIDLQNYFKNTIKLPDLTLQSAYFGFLEANKEDYTLVNIILLTFKITLYQQRTKKLNFLSFIRNISKREKIEKTFSVADPQKSLIHQNKWQRLYSYI